jgi:putative DNA-invertase from lambdoid prophage Rac
MSSVDPPLVALIGYARCSTVGQDLTAQIEALAAAGVPADRIFSEKISGAAPLADRKELQRALAALQPGDVLIVSKLDRVGRSMEDCVSRVAELLDSGCHVLTLDGRVDTKGLGRMAKLVCGLLAAAAEIERDLILERTEEGRQRALAAGVKFGRKRSYRAEQAEHVKELVGQGYPHRKVAAMSGLSATTVRRILQEA